MWRELHTDVPTKMKKNIISFIVETLRVNNNNVVILFFKGFGSGMSF
jgi:ribosomal protein S24E